MNNFPDLQALFLLKVSLHFITNSQSQTYYELRLKLETNKDKEIDFTCKKSKFYIKNV